MAPTLRLKKPNYAATTTTIAPIIAIFRNLCSRMPMINPMTNGMIINTIGGNPPILPEVECIFENAHNRLLQSS
jgi:hypothetical protein